MMTSTQAEVYLCTCYRLVIYEVGLHLIVGIVNLVLVLIIYLNISMLTQLDGSGK